MKKNNNPIKKLVLVKSTVAVLQERLTEDQLKHVGGGGTCQGTVPTSRIDTSG